MADIFHRETGIETPCQNICVIAPQSGLCIGCRRSRAEIADWGKMSAAQRRAVTAQLATRVAEPQARRGGRAGRHGHSGAGG